MSATATRTVRHLRLRGPDADGLRRVATTLEDALRVATLPDRPGRLVVVRRVRLPPLDPGGSSQSVARALEQALERTRVEEVHGTDPAAPAAARVWFADPVEAHVAAAAEILAHRRLDAWFWPAAIPALRAPGPPLRALARSLAAMEVAPVALPAWVAALAWSGGRPALARLVEALSPGDAAALVEAAGMGGAERPAGGGGSRGMVTDGSPGAAAPPAEVPVRALAVRGGAAEMLEESHPGERSPDRAAGGPAARDATPRPRRGPRPPGPPGRPPHGPTGTVPPAARGAAVLAPSPPPPAAAPRGTPPRPADGEPTVAGGLFFLLPVLARLGYARWSEAHPGWAAWHVAVRALRGVADRLAVPPDDPVRAALTLPDEPGRSPPPQWSAPPSFEGLRRPGPSLHRYRGPARTTWDSSGALLLRLDGKRRRGGRDAETRADAVAGAWAVAARRWLRRYTRLGIGSLVRRTAFVELSTTHLEVTFDLDRSDVRIRRAGLDLDPGWLPWFGRVVAFRYVQDPVGRPRADG